MLPVCVTNFELVLLCSYWIHVSGQHEYDLSFEFCPIT